jgi:hypothetical protein
VNAPSVYLLIAVIADSMFLVLWLIWRLPIFCRAARDRYRHFKIRRDRGPYRYRPNAYVGHVRAILSEAAERADRISGKYGIDDFIELLEGDRYRPRIWARITVSPRRIIVAIEYAANLDLNERILVDDIRSIFINEYVIPTAIRGAPVPRDYEFSRSLE